MITGRDQIASSEIMINSVEGVGKQLSQDCVNFFFFADEAKKLCMVIIYSLCLWKVWKQAGE